MALWRFHSQRFFSANYFSKNLIGFFAVVYIADFFAAKQFGVARMRDPNILWPWWLEFQQKIRTGVIPENTPGYSVAQFRNMLEERCMETLDVEAIKKERQKRIEAYYEHHGGHHKGADHSSGHH